MTKPMPVGTVLPTKNGYLKVALPQHPLAVGRWVLAHRAILWHVAGPSDQPCAYCGWLLPWQHPDGYRWCINVDHVNCDKHDNRPENLVPSCWFCNANRSWRSQYPDIYDEMVESNKHVHPADRNPITWLLGELTESRKAIAA